jgi:catechol 2,3-dioxygenase-like lactoylglutathione lyase family enzyme
VTKSYPKVINHIGVSVIGLNRAVSWYEEVLGFTVLRRETIKVEDSSLASSNFKTIFGTNFKRVNVVWLSSGNSVGFELFEFEDPEAEQRANNFEYWKSGVFHICITDPNIEMLCKKITDSGGRQLTNILHVNNSKLHHKLAYCQDPFGNIIEIFTHSYEQFIANT